MSHALPTSSAGPLRSSGDGTARLCVRNFLAIRDIPLRMALMSVPFTGVLSSVSPFLPVFHSTPNFFSASSARLWPFSYPNQASAIFPSLSMI